MALWFEDDAAVGVVAAAVEEATGAIGRRGGAFNHGYTAMGADRRTAVVMDDGRRKAWQRLNCLRRKTCLRRSDHRANTDRLCIRKI